MPHSFEVDCVRRDQSLDPYRRVTHVGGPPVDGVRGSVRFCHPVAQVIAAIRQGEGSFWIRSGERKLELAPAFANGVAYLRTALDRTEPLSLLSLPDCTGRSAPRRES